MHEEIDQFFSTKLKQNGAESMAGIWTYHWT